MTTFVLLFLLAHLLGDFVFQFNKIAEMKAKSLKGILIHVMIVGMIKVIIMGFFYGVRGVIIALCVASIHFLIDYMKLRLKKYIQRIQSLYFIFDQGLHLSVLFTVSQFLYISEPRVRVENAIVLVMILAIVSYYVLTILVKVIMVDVKMVENRPFFEKRERTIDGLMSLIALGVLLFSGGYLWLLVVLVLIIPYGLLQQKLYKYSYKVIVLKSITFIGFATLALGLYQNIA